MQHGRSGVITCHGFTGYSNEMDPIGACFQKNGFAWRNITLPGHCTSPEDLRRYRWQDWTSHVLAEIEAFQPKCSKGMVMIGLSMGGLLTLYALTNSPHLVAGVTLAAPIRPLSGPQSFQAWVLARVPILGRWVQNEGKDAIMDPEARKIHDSYPRFHTDSVIELNKLATKVRHNLDRIETPVLIIHSVGDTFVSVKNAYEIHGSLRSKGKELFLVERSSHVLTRDYDKDRILEKCLEFVRKVLQSPE